MIEQLNDKRWIDQVVDLELKNFGRDALTQDQLIDLVNNPNHEVFMYCKDEIVLGIIYINIIAAETLIHVMKLAVRDGYRRMGIASQLLRHIERLAQTKAMSRIILEVRLSNEFAIALYKKCAYLYLGTRKKFYQFPVEDAVVLVKHIE